MQNCCPVTANDTRETKHQPTKVRRTIKANQQRQQLTITKTGAVKIAKKTLKIKGWKLTSYLVSFVYPRAASAT